MISNEAKYSGFEGQPHHEESPTIEKHEYRFILWLAIGFIASVSISMIYGLALTRPGTEYIGFPFNTDDHMVYASWMRQAMMGRFMFDNRFAIEPQPSQTIHLYYLVIGWFSLLVGISLASNLARIALAGLFVPLIYRFISRLTPSVYVRKLCTVLTLIGGGLGFLVWHNFGRQLVIPHTLWMTPITQGILPTDIWQPEGFVYSSMLTNGLFAVSLCIIISVFGLALECRKNPSGRLVIIGAVLFGILMNIHSYDALLLTLVLMGFLSSTFGAGQAEKGWISRVVLIGCGAIPPALWFVHVIHVDKVFADRAKTLTFSADFRAVLIGYLPMLIFGSLAILRGVQPKENSLQKRRIGFAIALIVFVIMTVLATPKAVEMLNAPMFAILFAALLVSCYLLADENPAFNLIVAWALIGLLAPYFPSLFQRKLAMALSIPWAILAGLQIAHLLENHWRSSRNFATVFLLLLFGGSSVQWLLREFTLIRNDVSSTTVQPCYLKSDAIRIIAYLNKISQHRTVVVVMPGIPNPSMSSSGKPIPDSYGSPIVPDLNPILSGFAGVYTYAGHWSETPHYNRKRQQSMDQLFGSQASSKSGWDFLKSIQAKYIVGIRSDSLPMAHFNNLSQFGQTVVRGDQFILVKVGVEPASP